MRTWLVVVQEPVAAAAAAFDRWCGLNHLDPPDEAVRVDTIRSAETDERRYRIDAEWIASELSAGTDGGSAPGR